MPNDVYSMKEQANFDSLTLSISTLFQVFPHLFLLRKGIYLVFSSKIMLGESWDAVMNAAIDAHYGYYASIYFISFVLLVSVLFANLFIGLICDAYQKVNLFQATCDASMR